MNLPLLIQFLLCPVVLISLLRTTAPYGRHYRPGWGPVLPARRAWFLMELPGLLVVPGMVLLSTVSEAAAAWVPASLWAIHYSYRTLLFPALMRSSGRTFPALLVAFAIVRVDCAPALVRAAEQLGLSLSLATMPLMQPRPHGATLH